MSRLEHVPIYNIIVTPDKAKTLRGVKDVGAPKKQKTQYDEIKKSITERGVRTPIEIRPLDGEFEGMYGLVNGLQRLSICKGLLEKGHKQFETIPAHILDPGEVTEETLIEEQIRLNALRVETSHREFCDAINVMMIRNPKLTVEQIADRLDKSPSWVQQRLHLNKLPEDVFDLVEEGSIKTQNGYNLALLYDLKLPDETMALWLDKALTLPADEFSASAKAFKQTVQKERRNGTLRTGEEDVVFTMRKKGEIEDEWKRTKTAVQSKDGELPPFLKGYFSALSWVGKVDEETLRIKREEKATAEAKKREAAEAKLQTA